MEASLSSRITRKTGRAAMPSGRVVFAGVQHDGAAPQNSRIQELVLHRIRLVLAFNDRKRAGSHSIGEITERTARSRWAQNIPGPHPHHPLPNPRPPPPPGAGGQ